MKKFVHFHCHTEYSSLDGMSPVERGALSLDKDTLRSDQITLAAKAASLKQPGIAMTDHGTMGGFLRFYHDCRSNNINPIIGCEFYLVKNSKLRGTRPIEYHLVLIAKNYRGLQNLFALNQYAWSEGFYYRPHIDLKTIYKFPHDNIIALTACLKNPFLPSLIENNEETATSIFGKLQKIFKDDLYIELMPHNIPEQTKANSVLYDFAKKYMVPCLLTNDVHYCNKIDEPIHDAFVAIQTGLALDNPKRFKFSVGELYVKSGKRMVFDFLKRNPSFGIENCVQFIDNGFNLNKEINIELPETKTLVPVSDHMVGLDPYKYLVTLTKIGREERKLFKGIDDSLKKVYVDRVKKELSLIKKMGFVNYFLIVKEVVDFARETGIMVGPGRGSAAGSLVCYLLGITSIDPIKFDLMFERFINEHRISPPDIDLDFEDSRRDEVFDFIIKNFGEENVARIGSYTVLKGKLAFKDIARVYGVPFADSNIQANNIMVRKGSGEDKYETIKDSFKESEALQKFDKKYPKVLKTAIALEGTIRQAGIHPCGIVASPIPLSQLVPVETRKSKDNLVRTKVVALTAKEVEHLGLLKLDILALKTLSVLHQALDMAGVDFKILDEIGFDDKKVFEELSEDFVGVFQFDTSSFRELAKDFKFKTIEDVIVMAALGRPGPMQSGSAAKFLSVRVDKKRIKRVHPIYDEITKDTAGILIFQEQVIQLFHKLANYTLSDADKIRNAIGKSHGKQAIEKDRKTFIMGCCDHGMECDAAEKLFDTIVQFGKYGFNKAHAAAYGVLGYYCAWVRSKYPIEFIVALLNNEKQDHMVKEFLRWASEKGFKVQLPNVNISKTDYFAQGKNIYIGLSNIKNVGFKAAKSIIDNQPYNHIYDFFTTVDRRAVNKRVIKSLIQAGAMRPFCNDAQYFLDNLEQIIYDINMFKKTNIGSKEVFSWEKKLKEQEELTHSTAAYLRKQVLSTPLNESVLEYYAPLVSYIKKNNPGFVLSDVKDFIGSKPVKLAGYIIGEIVNIKYSNVGDYDTTAPNTAELEKRKRRGEIQGSRFCSFELEDTTEKIRAKIRPLIYQKLQKELHAGKGSVVLVKGKRIPKGNLLYVEELVNLSDMFERVEMREVNFRDRYFLRHPVLKKQGRQLMKKYNLELLSEVEKNSKMNILCSVSDVKQHKCKNGSWMAFVSIEDGIMFTDIVVWEDDFKRYGDEFIQSMNSNTAIALKVSRDGDGKFILEGKGRLVVSKTN